MKLNLCPKKWMDGQRTKRIIQRESMTFEPPNCFILASDDDVGAGFAMNNDLKMSEVIADEDYD
jgi:hypothetical protein